MEAFCNTNMFYVVFTFLLFDEYLVQNSLFYGYGGIVLRRSILIAPQTTSQDGAMNHISHWSVGASAATRSASSRAGARSSCLFAPEVLTGGAYNPN
jgi:hypothetical protein